MIKVEQTRLILEQTRAHDSKGDTSAEDIEKLNAKEKHLQNSSVKLVIAQTTSERAMRYKIYIQHLNCFIIG